MLVVTGATGQFGRLAVESLLGHVPASRVGVSVRDPGKAADLAARGVRVRRGNFDEPATLADAFAGAERVLIVSTDVPGPGRARLHRAAIAAAVAAGARQILHTGLVDPDVASPFLSAVDYVDAESALAESGVAYTVLRNSLYSEMAPMLLGGGLATGVVAAPADGPVGYATRAEMAEAAAIVLAGGGHEGEALALTGAEAVDLAGLAATASELAGRPIRREVVADADYRKALLARGFPPHMADLLLGLFAAAREGRFSRVDPALGRLIGRPPAPVRETLAAALRAGGG